MPAIALEFEQSYLKIRLHINMQMRDWLRSIADQDYVSLFKAKKLFAVHASGPMEGDAMRAESEFVRSLHSNPEDSITKWAAICEKSQLVDSTGLGFFTRKRQWTSPEAILREPSAAADILSGDIWCLLTDGEITSGSVADFIRLADRQKLMHVSLLLLVGDKHPFRFLRKSEQLEVLSLLLQ